MFWDDLMRRWRRDHRVASARLLAGAGGHVAVLPSRRGRRPRTVLVILAAAILALVALVASGQVRL